MQASDRLDHEDNGNEDNSNGSDSVGISIEITELPNPTELSKEIQQHLHHLRTTVPTFEDFCKDTHKSKPCEPCVTNNLVKTDNYSVNYSAFSVMTENDSSVSSSDIDLLTFTKRREKLSHQLNAPKRDFIGNMWARRSSTVNLSQRQPMSSSIKTKAMAAVPVRSMNGRMRLGFSLHH